MRKTDKALRDPHQNPIAGRDLRGAPSRLWIPEESRDLTELRRLACDRAIAIIKAEMREGRSQGN